MFHPSYTVDPSILYTFIDVGYILPHGSTAERIRTALGWGEKCEQKEVFREQITLSPVGFNIQ